MTLHIPECDGKCPRAVVICLSLAHSGISRPSYCAAMRLFVASLQRAPAKPKGNGKVLVIMLGGKAKAQCRVTYDRGCLQRSYTVIEMLANLC